MLAGEKTPTVGMTAVEIDNILATPELHELVESAEQTGSLRYADLAEVLEVLRLDPLETDAVYRGLEQRGIEVTEQEPHAEPQTPPPPQPVVQESTTATSRSCTRSSRSPRSSSSRTIRRFSRRRSGPSIARTAGARRLRSI